MPWLDPVDIAKRYPPPTKKEIEQFHKYSRQRTKPKFYADENFPIAGVRLLRANDLQVLTAQDASLLGHPDENHAAFALKNGRVLLTCDRDYLDEHRFPLIHCPAIVVCDFGSGSTKDMLKTFRCLRSILSIPQFFDKWTKIDAKRESWMEYSRFLDGTTAKSRFRMYRGRLQEWMKDATDHSLP